MTCPYCTKKAELIDSKDYYSNGVSYGMMYICRPCDTYVGCHGGTSKPLGTLAKKELRELRKQCHAKIDPLWQSGKMKRKNLYAFIALALKMPRDKTHVVMCRMRKQINPDEHIAWFS